MRSMIVISIFGLIVLYSCKKDTNISLTQFDLKKAILGKWEYHGRAVFKHNGEQSGEGVFFRFPIYNFLNSDSCITNRPDTATFNINYNTQINFGNGDASVKQGLYNVEIKDTDMIWRQVPPFPVAQPASTTIDSILIYFKRQS